MTMEDSMSEQKKNHQSTLAYMIEIIFSEASERTPVTSAQILDQVPMSNPENS